MRLFDQAKYSFIETRRRAYVFSAVLILVGIGAMIFNVFSIGIWQAYGVDFLGDKAIVSCEEPEQDTRRYASCSADFSRALTALAGLPRSM